MLSRELGCQAAYTPMFHAANFASSKKYRQKNFSTCPEDRPLFVQFCSNNADTLMSAAKHVENDCDSIDINLGCPQEIARRGHYGAFLQDDWNLISEMVSRLRNNVDNDLGVSCKIRRFDQVERTIEYARMLEKTGCTFIGIHGRTREQRGCRTGLADWDFIKAVKSSVNIPVIANGNIQSLTDAKSCLEYTKADAVMTAEGNLYNPALFLNIHPPAWTMAKKYLDYVKQYPIPAGMAKSHIFKLFHRCVAQEENADLRARLGQSTDLDHLYNVVECFRAKYETTNDGECNQSIAITVQPVPPYLCQPRYRYNENILEVGEKREQIASCSEEILTDCAKKRIKLTAG